MNDRPTDPRRNQEYLDNVVRIHPPSQEYQEFLDILSRGDLTEIGSFKDKLSMEHDHLALGILNRRNHILQNADNPTEAIMYDRTLKHLNGIKKLKGRQIDQLNKKIGEVKKNKGREIPCTFMYVAKKLLSDEDYTTILEAVKKELEID
jgi:hypothetical protein